MDLNGADGAHCWAHLAKLHLAAQLVRAVRKQHIAAHIASWHVRIQDACVPPPPVSKLRLLPDLVFRLPPGAVVLAQYSMGTRLYSGREQSAHHACGRRGTQCQSLCRHLQTSSSDSPAATAQRLSAQRRLLPSSIVASEKESSLTKCPFGSTFAVVLIVLALNDTSGCECPVNV